MKITIKNQRAGTAAILAAQAAANVAEDAWSAELSRVFPGRHIGDMRFDARGHSTPELARLMSERDAAITAMHAAWGYDTYAEVAESALVWHSVTPSWSLVPGTEISHAVVPGAPGESNRYMVCEMRGKNQALYYDVRDAETLSDADVKAGKRACVVFSSPDSAEALAFCRSN